MPTYILHRLPLCNMFNVPQRSAILAWSLAFLFVSPYQSTSAQPVGSYLGPLIDSVNGSLTAPGDVEIGPDGYLYFDDNGQGILRYDRITAAFIDVFVPLDDTFLTHVTRHIFGPDGDLYLLRQRVITSTGESMILRYDGATGVFLSTVVDVLEGDRNAIEGFAFGPDGNLYTAHRRTHEVLRFDGQTGVFIDTFIDSGSGGLSRPNDLFFGPDGYLYISSADDFVLRYDASTGAFVDVFLEERVVVEPSKMVLGPDKTVFIDGFTNVHQFSLETGALIKNMVIYGGRSSSYPNRFTIGPDHVMYVCDSNRSTVFQFDAVDNRFLGMFYENEGFDSPTDFVFSDNGFLYATSPRTESIFRYDLQTGDYVELIREGDGGLDVPRALTIGPDGKLYVTSLLTHEIKRFNSDNGLYEGTLVESESGGLRQPGDLAFSPSGDLFVSSVNPSAIYRYDGQTGEFENSFPTPTQIGFNQPKHIAFGPDGLLYVGFFAGGITSYDPETGERVEDVILREFPTSLSQTGEFAFGSDGHLYVAYPDLNEVHRYNGETWEFIDVVVSTDEIIVRGLEYMTFGPGGHLYVSNWRADQILTFAGPSPVGVAFEEQSDLDKQVAISAYPNPFSGTTTISYALGQPTLVWVAVYDVLGRHVQTLKSVEQAAGKYELVFDAGNLPAGIYYYRVLAGNTNQVGKLVLVE